MASIAPHLKSVINQDGAVILDIRHNVISTLNPTGAFVWERLQNGMKPDAIVIALATETGMEKSIVLEDVKTFLKALRSKQLVARS